MQSTKKDKPAITYLQVRMSRAEHDGLVEAAGHRQLNIFSLAAINAKVAQTMASRKKIRKTFAR